MIREVSSLAETRTAKRRQYGLSKRVGRRTVLANITALLVKVDEFAERADDVDVLTSPCDAQLGALVEAVVKDLERLQDVAPILALVVEALVEHVHDFVEIRRAEKRASVLSAGRGGWKLQTCCR
jgi:hypothetical protein